jgi:hypothetical protein
MNNKLAVSFVLATTTFAGSAFAEDPPPKFEIVEDRYLVDELYNSEYGKRMIDVLQSDEPIIDEMDPGARCDDIDAGKQFNWPLYSTDIAGFNVHLGVSGDIGIVADSTRIAAEASFGPSLKVFGQIEKPIDLKLSASTNSMGENSVDLSLLAFGYELDSYNLASSTAPLEYITAVGWNLPNVLSGTWGDSYDCDFFLTDSCSISWRVTPLVASVAGIFVLRVNSNGVQAHALASAKSYSAVTISGGATATLPNGSPITIAATGTGVINFLRGMFWGSATLAPHNSHWLATAESSISVEDVFGAKVSARLDLSDLDADPREYTLLERQPMGFSDLWAYQCSFDKDFK